MANQKIQLKSVNGNKLFPRTSINNIVGEDFTTSTRSCPTGAIDRRQYEKSLTCMAEKMGIDLDKDD